jgi:hypothetical protein
MKPLPNVTFDLGQNWAGNVAVDRVGHPNNTLFFWAFEKENGSLTAKADERTKEPWGIWLNGGCVLFLVHHLYLNVIDLTASLSPGSSSMLGLLTEVRWSETSTRLDIHSCSHVVAERSTTVGIQTVGIQPVGREEQLQLGQAGRLLLARSACVSEIAE